MVFIKSDLVKIQVRLDFVTPTTFQWRAVVKIDNYQFELLHLAKTHPALYNNVVKRKIVNIVTQNK